MTIRIGTGYDLHPLVSGRRLLLGGVHIPYPLGEKGHSDGDVLLHAVIDALLGAAALGDIGTHFPPSDPSLKGVDSTLLLRKTWSLLEERGYSLGNLDATVILEQPKLQPHTDSIRRNLAAILKTDVNRISVKAKTKEGLDATGQGKAVEALCTVLIYGE